MGGWSYDALSSAVPALATAPQGASPQEVRQKVNVVQDDPEGWGTWNPASRPTAVDISITPFAAAAPAPAAAAAWAE
jgi:hypothetical protein